MTRLARPDRSDPVLRPFFEAYFSNFIEPGTEFAVDEAADIVFNGYIPKARPADAHDILGTWKVVSDEREMSRLPRHLRRIDGAYDAAACRESWKAARSRVTVPPEGGSGIAPDPPLFVAPELVEGTLAKGFEIYRALTCPFHRAVFMMFLVSEVHPFADGNGRVARVMMNAELVAAQENRIIIPTIYRNNYMIAFKALSQNGIPGALVRTMDFAHRYTAAIDFPDLSGARVMSPSNSRVCRFERGRFGRNSRLTMPAVGIFAGQQIALG